MEKMRLDVVGDGVAVVFTATQTNEIYQTISLILTIIGILASLAYTIWKWVKDAKADGVISADELKEITDKTLDATKEVVDKLANKDTGDDE